MELDRERNQAFADEDSDTQYSLRSGNLFIVDGTKGMHENPGQEMGTYFQQALSMYENILRRKLIRNRDDWMGLVLFGTTKNDPGNENIRTLLEFGPVSVEMLRKLIEIMQHKIRYYMRIASEQECPLPQVLQYAARSFGSIKIKMPTRQVNLVTCCDNPLKDNELKHRARLYAKDFKDIQVSLKVIGFGDTWNFDLFYKELEMLASGSQVEPKRSLPADIQQEVMKKPVDLGQLDLRVAEKVLMKVHLQTFVKSRPALRRIAMDERTNEPLDSVVQFSVIEDLFNGGETYGGNEENDEASEDITNTSIRKCQTVGGRDILLTLSEAKSIAVLKPKGIDILRFEKNLKNPSWYYVPPSLFLGLPRNAETNEKTFFTSLLLNCQEKNLMAICAATVRENGRTHLFRMWPCPEFNGFYFFRIPFEEDINRTVENVLESLAKEAPNTMDEEKLKIMEKVIKKFRIAYTPAVFPNPRLSKQQQYLLALALNEEWDEAKYFEDYTKPAVDVLEEILSKKGLLDAFFKAFPSTRPSTRLVPEVDVVQQPPKMAKIDREQAHRMLRGQLTLYTVPTLRTILKALDLPLIGVKSVLVERLQRYVRSSR